MSEDTFGPDTEEKTEDEAFDFDTFDEPERARALAAHLNEDPTDFEEHDYGHYGWGYTYSIGNREYAVMTEEEADAAWDASLDSYLDECVLPEVPEMWRNYFDEERWKQDARFDGRAHALSSYDGSEDTITDPESGDSFVVFRTN